MSKQISKSVNVFWNPSSGTYVKPPQSIFGKLYCRKIKVYAPMRHLMKHVIGKGGKHFYDFTSKYNLVYIFYHEENIEIWGKNKSNVHACIHEMISHMQMVREKHRQHKNNLLSKNEEIIV
jgi:hypothetical protein